MQEKLRFEISSDLQKAPKREKLRAPPPKGICAHHIVTSAVIFSRARREILVADHVAKRKPAMALSN